MPVSPVYPPTHTERWAIRNPNSRIPIWPAPILTHTPRNPQSSSARPKSTFLTPGHHSPPYARPPPSSSCLIAAPVLVPATIPVLLLGALPLSSHQVVAPSPRLAAALILMPAPHPRPHARAPPLSSSSSPTAAPVLLPSRTAPLLTPGRRPLPTLGCRPHPRPRAQPLPPSSHPVACPFLMPRRRPRIFLLTCVAGTRACPQAIGMGEVLCPS